MHSSYHQVATLCFLLFLLHVLLHTFSLCTLTFLAFSLIFNMWPPLFKQNQHKPCLDITSPTRTHLNTGQIMSFNHQPFFFFFWVEISTISHGLLFQTFHISLLVLPIYICSQGKKSTLILEFKRKYSFTFALFFFGFKFSPSNWCGLFSLN